MSKIFAVVELEQPEDMKMNSYEFTQTVLGGVHVLFTATGYEGLTQESESDVFDPEVMEVNALTGYFEGIQFSPSYTWGAIIDYGEGNLGDQFNWTGSVADAERHFMAAIPDITEYGNYDVSESDEDQETVKLVYYRPYADQPDETQVVTVYLSRSKEAQPIA